MKKINKIFIGLIILEMIALIILSSFFMSDCGSACDRHSLLNPFGFGKSQICILVCVPNTPNPLIYPIADLLILTILIYLIYLVVNKFKNSKSLKGGAKNK